MFTVDPSDPTPIYAQLERSIRASIVAGQLGSGDRLPTVRQLAVDLRLNANTVAKVYAELERAGVVATQRGVGTFVRDPGDSLAVKPSARDKERALHLLSDRLLADAYAIGLTIDEVIRHLEARRVKESDRQ
jgi:GntR family transcriptional regulator